MKNGLSKTVHIIPLGHERERATLPFLERTADLIYLVVDNGYPDENGNKNQMQLDQETFTDLVVTDLTQMDLTVKIVHTDTFKLTTLINTLSKIIILEKDENSNIFMNMSASGRYASVAASIAGMAHDISLYYVHSNNFSENREQRMIHGVSICTSNKCDVDEVVNFRFEMPTAIELSILELLYDKSLNGYQWATTKELADTLYHKYPDFEEMPVFRGVDTSNMSAEEKNNRRKVQSKVLMKLNGSIMKKLIVKKYAERNDPGESGTRYKITPSGEYALHLSGFGEPIKIEDYVRPDWIATEIATKKRIETDPERFQKLLNRNMISHLRLHLKTRDV